MPPILSNLDENHRNLDGTTTKTTQVVDVTADAITFDLATKARAAIAANNAWLPQSQQNPTGRTAAPTSITAVLAQVDRLTREQTATIKLLMGLLPQLGGSDLLLDNTGT